MSKVFGTIFGTGSKERSGSSNSSASGYAALPEFAQNAWQDLVGNAQGLSGDSSVFQNAPTTALQTQGQNTLSQAYTPQTNEQFQAGIQKFMDPYTQDVINSTNNTLQQNAGDEFSKLAGDATQQGAFGGSRQGVAQSLIARDLNNTIAGNTAALNSAGFNTAVNNNNNEYQNTFTNQQNQGINQINAGTQQQAINTQNQQAPATALSWLQQILSGLNSSTSQGQSSSASNGATPGLIGNLATALSDRRLKNNIVRIGIENGHNVYEFNYNAIEGRYRGVMADEVKEIDPSAVIETQDGFMGVHYDKIGIEFRRIQ